MREKFTTTLNKETKRKLAVLSANDGLDRNEWIEKMVNIEWGKFINDMGANKNQGNINIIITL